MGGELLAAVATPDKPPPIPSTTTTTTTDGTTTISSLGQDQILEIFLRLPNLTALVRAALTCRSWLDAVRSSPPFRRQFRTLHPAPLLGVFLQLASDDTPPPSFHPSIDPDVAAALRHGDFSLTSLPAEEEEGAEEEEDSEEKEGAEEEDSEEEECGRIMDCRNGYILLIKTTSIIVVNPMTWEVDTFPWPDDAADGSSVGFTDDCTIIDWYLQCSDENPRSFRVVCVCADESSVRAAVYSSKTRDWIVHNSVEIGGDNKYSVGTLVDGSVYWPLDGEARMIMINRATMDVSFMDLPSLAQVNKLNFMAGETKDGELCIVYASVDFHLHVWIRGVDGDGIEIWVLQNKVSLAAQIDRFTHGLQGDLEIWQVSSGHVYLSMTCMIPASTLRHCWFFSLPLETMEIGSLIKLDGTFELSAYPYAMAWPRCLIGDDGSTGHEVEASH